MMLIEWAICKVGWSFSPTYTKYMIGQKENCWYDTYKELIVYKLDINLWSKVVCFVMFRSPKPKHAMLLVSLESSRWIWVHWLRLRLFGAMLWKLLIIEPFSPWKINKIETENYIGIWGHSWCYWKALGQVRFNRVYYTIFRAKVWKMLIFEWILLQEIPTNCKKWIWKEKSVELSTCLHCQI
jgi:hypothetical protein